VLPLDESRLIAVTCPRGLVDFLRAEIDALGFAIDEAGGSHVNLRGTLRDAMRLNLHLRTAIDVLYLLAEFDCDSPEDLYGGTREIPWEAIVPADGYLSVDSHVRHESMISRTFPNVLVKDAVVDRILEKTGRRPDSGPSRDRTVLHLFWHERTARVFLNTSGRKLSDRNYRKIPHSAPMNEALAAGVLMAAGYTGAAYTEPLVNPMCGSGTLAIEAALMATGRPLGLLRSHFGFQHVAGFDASAWESVRREARKTRPNTRPGPIIASDIDERAATAARKNAQTAGVDHLIEFHVCDFADTPMPGESGVVIMNPEYGLRLGEVRALEETYARIGDFFKQKCAGWRGFIFTGNLELAKKVGLKAKRRMVFHNAQIECRLLEYELYAGTRRTPKPPESSEHDVS
jgi:putative N6-adenine-specific DNA methylase